MEQTTPDSIITTPPAKKAKIHVFFCGLREGKKGYDVFSIPNSKTASDLNSVGGMFECVDFQSGQNPEAMKADMLRADKTWQGHLTVEVDMHFFCDKAYRETVVNFLEASKDEFQRELVLHVGDAVVGWATFVDEGYACGGNGTY